MKKNPDKRKPDPQDYEAVEREHGSLPQDASQEQQLDRYRLAQNARLIRLYDQGKLPDYLMRHVNKIRKQPKNEMEPWAALYRSGLSCGARLRRDASAGVGQEGATVSEPLYRRTGGSLSQVLSAYSCVSGIGLNRVMCSLIPAGVLVLA